MSDDKGPFEFPDNAGDPGLEEDPYGLSVEWDEDGNVTPSLTIPGGDLQPGESDPSPNAAPSGTTPFDPDHNPVDRSIYEATHPDEGVQLPHTPGDPLHLGLLPNEHMVGEFPIGPTPNDDPTDLGPGDYVVPADDPALADSAYGSGESGGLDAFG